MNTQEFIFESKQIHGDKYDYSKSVYVNAKTKIAIICPKHGEFEQLRKNHKMGKGCSKCAIELRAKNNTHTIEKFIEKARKIHGDKYDYSSSVYNGDAQRITIKCPKHGEFTHKATSHLQGVGCYECGKEESAKSHLTSWDETISEFMEIHGNKYDYSKAKYNNRSSKIIIICSKHGEFNQSPRNHIHGQGCPECGKIISRSSSTLNTEWFIEKASGVHDNKYDYSLVKYESTHSDIDIICPKHGEFKQAPHNHLRGKGCKECANDNVRVGFEEFRRRASVIHQDKYDYSCSSFLNTSDLIDIICREHGVFQQTVASHLYQCAGCPKCNISNIHSSIINMIPDGIDHTINNRNVLDGLEIDSYFPRHKFGVEVHGEYFHGLRSNNIIEHDRIRGLHQNKSVVAEQSGIKLYQFWGLEISEKPAIVESMILNVLGFSNREYARKASIEELKSTEVKDFFNKSHLQGHRHSRVNLALVRNGEIIACLTLSRHSKYEWEIIRYANKLNTTVVGGFARLLKRFVDTRSPKSIMTFADRRYSVGSIYLNNGFRLVDVTRPNYFYYKSNYSLSRQKCQKHKLDNLLGDGFDENRSETSNMLANGFTKVFDAGHQKLVATF